ncbi:MAG: hypothetical protein AAF251_02990 [Pseudomonadota bacterium]
MSEGHNGSSWLADLMSNRPFIVGALFLGTYFAPFLILIGFPLAFVFRARPEEDWEQSHFDYLIRTVWIALLIAIVAAAMALSLHFAIGDNDETPLVYIIIGVLGSGLAFALCGVRVLISMMKSASRIPITNSKSWLI